MKIGIIDADLLGRKKHRFPNLACMKISGYHKSKGDVVKLVMDYKDIIEYDKVYMSMVFTDTPYPKEVLVYPNLEYGGTGFFFDKAPNLPYEIEHSFPDYHLYDDFVNEQLKNGAKRVDFKEYLDYSIGFLTRGCFRKCKFCVNQKYDKVYEHSPLDEFYDKDRKKICLLDDNFFGCSNWRELLNELISTGKRFKFKQGLDERLLTDEKCKVLCKSKYDGAMTFAFDNVEDYGIIEQKLKLLRTHTHTQLRFYVLCGFDRNNKYDAEFWKKDIENLFKRIELLIRYNCLPYVMRFNKYAESPYKGLYITIARWCNQPSMFKKNSLQEFCELHKKGSSIYEYLEKYEADCPTVAKKYYFMKWKSAKKKETNMKLSKKAKTLKEGVK